MTPQRAKRILRVLGWRYVDFQRELNRVARTSYKSGDVWKWFSGVRAIPLGAAIFLRQQVQVAILKRRLGQQDGPPEMSETASIAIKELRELADTLECGAAELVDIEFGGDDDGGDRSRLVVDYRLLRAPAERLLVH
jgi:hypothetical protein